MGQDLQEQQVLSLVLLALVEKLVLLDLKVI